MVEIGEQVEGDYPGVLNSGFFTATFAALEQHCMSVSAPVVQIGGSYRADQLNLLQLLSITRRYSLVEAPTHTVEGTMLRRRISTLHQGRTVQENADLLEATCTHHSQPATALLVPWVNLLDPESTETLDLVIRRGNVGVFMTALGETGLGFRLSRALQSERGFQAHLEYLTDAESHQLLSEILDEPPTAALARYLSNCAGNSSRTLALLARAGITEGWIRAVRRRSIMSRLPSWLDRQSAWNFCLRVREELGESVLKLLQRIALNGHAEMYQLADEPDVYDALFALAGAGLVEIEGTQVSINRPSDQRDLLLGPQIGDDDAPTPQAVIRARMVGSTVTPEVASAAATALLEQGMVDQARLLLARDKDPSGWTVLIEACADICDGAPFRALEQLDSADRDNRAQVAAAAGNAEAPGSQDSHADQVRCLRVFISGVLLRRPISQGMAESPFSSILETLAQLDGVADHADLGRLRAPSQQRDSAPEQVSGKLNLDLLAQIAEAALAAYVLALHNAQEEATAALRRFESLPLSEMPIIGLNWVLETVGRARLLTTPSQGALADAWFREETPERRMVRILISDALRLYQGLICGEPQSDLRVRLEDLWSQFEGGLAAGSVSRRLLEAFDFAIEGDRSEDLLGPASTSSPSMGGPFGDPWVDVTVEIGRILHCPASELEKDLDSRFSGWLSMPAVQRLFLRAVILRRGATLTPAALQQLSCRAEKVGVEPAVIDFARAVASEDQTAVSAARGALHRQYPQYTAVQEAAAVTTDQTGPALRADLMILLSLREQEVVQRLIAGDTDVQAAQVLGGISVRTVQTHVRNIYRKLEVSSRTELRATLRNGRANHQ